jgi:hypothetical protein
MSTPAFDPRSVVETDGDSAAIIWDEMAAEGQAYTPAETGTERVVIELPEGLALDELSTWAARAHGTVVSVTRVPAPEAAELKHNHTPQPFGRRMPYGQCPRCDALHDGAEPKPGWRSRKDDDEQRAREIRAHDCQRSGCGGTCTFGDW